MKRHTILTLALPAGLVSALLLVESSRAQQEGTTLGQRAKERLGKIADPEFIREALSNLYTCNLFELEVAKLAAEKAEPNDVRQFAKTMSDRQTQVMQKVKDLAGQKNVTLPELDAWQKSKLEFLRTLPGDKLGRAYIFHEVGENHTAMLWYRYMDKRVADDDIRQFVTRRMTDVQQRLGESERIANQIITEGGTVRPVSEQRP